MTRIDPIPTCTACPIRHRAVCAHCDAAELAMLAEAKTYRTIPAGASMARAGETLAHFSSLVTGVASMSRTLADGRRQNVGLLLPSDYIGRPGRAVSPFDVEALTEVTLCRFERGAFERIVRDTPHISARLLSMTLDELDAARAWAVVLGRMTAREKVAALLVSLTRRMAGLDRADRPSGRTILHLPVSRETMADHLGLTIETTSRQITALRKEGLIEVRGARDIVIPDFAALAAASGEHPDDGPMI